MFEDSDFLLYLIRILPESDTEGFFLCRSSAGAELRDPQVSQQKLEQNRNEMERIRYIERP